MAEEELLKLFERNWSERSIIKKDKENLNGKSREKRRETETTEEKEEEVLKNFPVSFLVERAMSDETMMTTSSKTSLFSSSSDDLFLSPRSVLPVKPTPMKLQTILSGKEVNAFTIAERERVLSEKEEQRKKKKKRNVRTRKGKSMSDLEYEELKGFMDLGFVFSEEDHKDSNLVSILPGLQRLVKKDDGVVQVTKEEEDKSSGNRVARPYLSEAWDHCGGRKGKITTEIKWRVPAPVANEVDLKDNLRHWAHAVASTIRR
ncbi:hypothetical protein ARALYDRAFT_483373 [Arabidopsis lyrata subsp. lyrata]|uniref:DUF1685 family protein n=1 Tax=Arabidopsis lyrata subsp. lyrata TaxID=81972 RepID=D7LJC8_ARALL|nr:uncharacterized protein LOC9316072 [Arabidopsis lyrata subsp. lyrata]EFH58130.1 hypothetical protein ARALYDRAFT_483373 [Arabidopsis lyrata subsp. lyrata]|eukprot:XP_020882992.1 uncharacterized protein LOC9316072 [Arabidopsis lyrata subsp. lyrata]